MSEPKMRKGKNQLLRMSEQSSLIKRAGASERMSVIFCSKKTKNIFVFLTLFI
jgi:hypothetical protein